LAAAARAAAGPPALPGPPCLLPDFGLGRRLGGLLARRAVPPRPRRSAAVAVPAVRPPRARLAVALPVAVVGRLHVGDVQEPVPTDAEIDERRLDARLDVDDAALVDVADVTLVAGPLDVQLFQDAVFQDGDAALLGL